MPNGNRDLAQALHTRLHLETPPVALSFVDSAPTGIPVFSSAVPSACTLWRKAEQGVFFAPAATHFNCPIGTLTMGFDMPQDVKQQLMMFVEKMAGCGYILESEPAQIPSVKRKSAGILYGPLNDFPQEPDLILMWLTPRQAMIYSEAAGTCRWTEASPTAARGRPACAVLPVALDQSKSALSLGCSGMRTFTEVSDNRLLAVLPAQGASEILRSLESTLRANREMLEFYEQHKMHFQA